MANETLDHKEWKKHQRKMFEKEGYQVIEEYRVNSFGNEKFDLVAKKGKELIILEYERGNYTAQAFRNLYKGIHLKPTKIIHDCKLTNTAYLSLAYSKEIKNILPETEIVVMHNGEVLKELSKKIIVKRENNVVRVVPKASSFVKCCYKKGIWVIELVKDSRNTILLKQNIDISKILDKNLLYYQYPEYVNELESYFNKNKFWVDILKNLLKLDNSENNNRIKDVIFNLPKYQFLDKKNVGKYNDKKIDELLEELNIQEKQKFFVEMVYEKFSQLNN